MNPRHTASRLRVGAGILAASVLTLSVIACTDAAPEDDGTSGGSGGAPAAAGGMTGKSGASATGGSTTAGTGNPTAGTNAGVGGSTGGTGPTAGSGGTFGPSGGSGSLGGTGTTLGGAGGSAGMDVPLAGAAGTTPTAGSGGSGGEAHTRDHCLEGFDAAPADATMVDGPAEYTESGQIDLTVQPGVLKWMQDHEWEPAHFEWHSIRRCNGGGSQSKINVCQYTEMIPVDQECKSDGDGLQFLAMHRHMIQSLKQLFPTHTEQFEGFDTFPQSADEVPEQWRADWRAFSSSELANAKIADEIAKPENLSKFATEGAFGRWLQCLAPSYSGLHGALHFKWVRTQNTTHGLGNQFTNIDNYMFWKLHGWIDKVWEKYRVAKGMSPDDPALKQVIVDQCREMDKLATLIDPNTEDPDLQPLPPESGVFHTMVRPMFENSTTKCSGCHGHEAPEVGMTLGGHKSSADIVAGLVNVPSLHGGQFMRVKPGDPEHSWLYLKASAMAANAGCTPTNGNMCETQPMPPSGTARPTTAELNALRDWIMAGAPAPTSP